MKIYLIWFEKATERQKEKEREREKILYLLVHSLDSLTDQGWGRWKSGARSLFQDSHMGAEAQPFGLYHCPGSLTGTGSETEYSGFELVSIFLLSLQLLTKQCWPHMQFLKPKHILLKNSGKRQHNITSVLFFTYMLLLQCILNWRLLLIVICKKWHDY